jgi:hypothetical protein
MTPIWKLVEQTQRQKDNGEIQAVIRVWDNGVVESCLVTDEAYLVWVAQGNTPQPSEEVTK